MDPISQGALGAAAAQAGTLPGRRQKMAVIALFGCLAGMAPDLDVLIQSPTDPLLFLEYHRHFTHALIFIPAGALIASLCLHWLFRHPLNFAETYLACFLGYATHALLDACTSYGTQLFWPFSDMRVAWNNVSVIDPLFTLPLLTLVIAAVWRQRPQLAWAGLAWAAAYLLLGAVQLERATRGAAELAAERGHVPMRLTMKPSFANLLLWKSIYEHKGVYYVDAVRTGLRIEACEGGQIEKLVYATHLPQLDRASQQAADIERFRWFSDDYLAAYHAPDQAAPQVVDIRYSMVPNQVDPMWGLLIDPAAATSAHVRWQAQRRLTAAKRAAFGALLAGDGCRRLWHDAAAQQ